MSSRLVSLTWHEQYLAAQVGMMRYFRALKDARKDAHGVAARGADGMVLHVNGAMGEMALAKCLGLYWNGSIDTFKSGGDVGPIHVRTRSQPSYELLVRDDDPPGCAFVHVRGGDGVYEVVGWLLSDDAKQGKWRTAHGDRPAAYFVPDVELHDIATLPLTGRPHLFTEITI